MRIAVYPHDLAMGGSQLNAIEIAGAVHRLGHPTVVVGRRGSLVERIEELGLEFIETPAPWKRPSRRVASFLRNLAAERKLDIVHGYEWPPTLEAIWSTAGRPTRAVSTVMSMAVAPFIPMTTPLLVGTEQILEGEKQAGRRHVGLLEPPVDLQSNDYRDDYGSSAFRRQYGIAPDDLLVLVVTRLAHQLKLEGVLAAIEAVGRLRSRWPIRLCIVGDGPARETVEEAAAAGNRQWGEQTVIVTGELADPRPAYQAGDIALGMGGSALRAMAFEKPLIVQGELGFWRTLDDTTVGDFLWTGWYGHGLGSSEGVQNLMAALEPLASDPGRRRDLGRYGRQLVEERFSIERAAEVQVHFYERSLAETDSLPRDAASHAMGLLRYASYYASKRVRRARGLEQVDDFNAKALMPKGPDRKDPMSRD